MKGLVGTPLVENQNKNGEFKLSVKKTNSWKRLKRISGDRVSVGYTKP